MQAELLEQSSLIADLASKLETVTRDVTGLGRYCYYLCCMTDMQHISQQITVYACYTVTCRSTEVYFSHRGSLGG